MKRISLLTALLAAAVLVTVRPAGAGQAPGADSEPDVPISHRDRVYAAEQFSNTVSVTDPADNKLLGVIRLGDPTPSNLSPLYRGQLLVHGMGFSPDHRTIAVVSIGSNAVTFIDTATNAVKHVTYVGRSPHEAFFTRDGKEVWVTVRGENYVAVLDGVTYEEKTRIIVPAGPGMQIFSPDGTYGYVCSSFNPETVVITVADHQIVGRIPQPSPFCPNIAASPDGKQVWLTLKDTGKVVAFDAHPPFAILKTIDTGPITNHVNFARNANGLFAYVTVGGLNEVQAFRTEASLCPRTLPRAERQRHLGTVGGIHDEPGGIGDRQRNRPHTTGRTRRGQDTAPLSRDRSRHRGETWRSRSGPGAMIGNLAHDKHDQGGCQQPHVAVAWRDIWRHGCHRSGTVILAGAADARGGISPALTPSGGPGNGRNPRG